MRRMLFEKTGTAIWMSHLDTMRLMQRAFRRAGVLLHHSQGYTPHAYVSMLLPLSVGVESCCEIMEYELDSALTISPAEMNAVLPQGVRVLEVYESGRKAKELSTLRAELRLEYDGGVPAGCAAAIESLLGGETLFVEKRTKRGMEQTDIRTLLYGFELKETENALLLDCRVSAQDPALNPLLLVTAIETHLPALKSSHARCRRVEVLDVAGEAFR